MTPLWINANRWTAAERNTYGFATRGPDQEQIMHLLTICTEAQAAGNYRVIARLCGTSTTLDAMIAGRVEAGLACGRPGCENTKKLQWCTCYQVRFCSKECQASAWKLHKAVCRAATQLPRTPEEVARIAKLPGISRAEAEALQVGISSKKAGRARAQAVKDAEMENIYSMHKMRMNPNSTIRESYEEFF
jgi:hypothetical protein